MIISLVVKYVCEEKLKEEILAPINHIRLRKKVYLPCKLVGVDGKSKTKAFKEINECSSIRWKFSFEQVPQASNKTRSIWNQFIQ